MKESEAIEILNLLVAGFPGTSLEPLSVKLWVETLTDLADATLATQLALSWVKREETFPKMATFRRSFRSLETSAAETRSDRLGLPEAKLEAPRWVSVWWYARNVTGDKRGLPEPLWTDVIEEGGKKLPIWEGERMTDEEFAEHDARWIEAGSPACHVKQLIGAVAG